MKTAKYSLAILSTILMTNLNAVRIYFNDAEKFSNLSIAWYDNKEKLLCTSPLSSKSDIPNEAKKFHILGQLKGHRSKKIFIKRNEIYTISHILSK